MEWMEIEAQHPENPYNQAHSSDEGVIEFEGVIVLDVITSGAERGTDNSFQEYNSTEIMDFNETTVSSLYRYGVLDFFDDSKNYVCISFLFKKSTVMWNKLADTSWFEDLKFQKGIQTEEILTMLSQNNDDKTQKQGIELASKLKYLGHLFQPVIDNESKSLWENCAQILNVKTDEELNPWLIDCFIWLQDMNWPGAEIIANRLKAMKDTDNYEYNKQKAVRIAEIVNDKEWLENLRLYL